VRPSPRRRWALTAVPGAVLLAVVAWPSVQGAPPVGPVEVPARAAAPPEPEVEATDEPVLPVCVADLVVPLPC
jgi:hypothetical protein